MKPRKVSLVGLGWNLLLLLVLLALFHPWGGGTSPAVNRYSDFLQAVSRGQVETVQVGADSIVYGLKRDRVPVDSLAALHVGDNPETFRQVESTVPLPNDRELLPLLRHQKVQFAISPPPGNNWLAVALSWLLPILIIAGLWGFMMSRAGSSGPLTVGRSRARIHSEGQTGISFADVAGVDEAKAELAEVVDFLRHSDRYVRLGARIPKGVLLVGPPGTGKTMLAKAVAGEASVPFYSISGSEFIELFVGVGAARVRDLFAQAQQKAPCIVFIDELDALGKSRTSQGPMMGGNDEREQTLNQLLSDMDGFEPNAGVVILAATNRPEVLDPALRRPGRFDRVISVDPPDRQGREAILRVHVAEMPLDAEVDVETIARRTPGFVGADLANLVNEAALLAARQGGTTITTADFNEAIERVIGGLEKKSRILSDKEKSSVAHHEAGHALVGSVMPGANKVEKISIVPRGLSALGYTWQIPQEERFLMQEDEVRGRLATLMGGRAAELVMFGKLSTGAGDDLQKATDLAEQAVTMYGMSRLGPVTFDRVEQRYLPTSVRRGVGPGTAEAIDREIQSLLTDAEETAQQVLRANLPLLQELAAELLTHEIMEGPSLQRILNRVELPDTVQRHLGRPDPSVSQPTLTETERANARLDQG